MRGLSYWRKLLIHVNLFQQLKAYQNISVNLGLLDIEDIVTETGYNVPCKYTEYSLPTSSVDTYILDNETTFGILMASKKVEKRTQILMYPFPSFVSESGGALGLFVGFSFNMLWDLGEVCFHLLLRRKWDSKCPLFTIIHLAPCIVYFKMCTLYKFI